MQLKKIGFFIFLIALVISLCTCKGDTPPNGGDTEASHTSADRGLSLVENGISAYTIVVSDLTAATDQTGVNFKKALREITGCELSITTDWKKNPVSEYEILIGKTEREGTEIEVLDRSGLDETGFLICTVGNRLIITGDSPAGTQNGIDYFLETYGKDGNITVDATLHIRQEQQYPVKSFTLQGHDIAEFVIVCEAGAGRAAEHAAQELQTYIKKACGTTLTITDAVDATPAIRLSVTDGDSLWDMDGYTVESKGDDLVICGHRARGILYGAYEFLEAYVGWRFLTEEIEYLRADETLALSDISLSHTPYFICRDVFWSPYYKKTISEKRRINSAHARDWSAMYGGALSFATERNCHTMTQLYGCTDAEQPCLSDEKTYDTVLANVLKCMEEKPDAAFLSVSQNDNRNYCTCAACTAVVTEEGGQSGVWIRFVNRIADAIEERYPNTLVHTLAYLETTTAPKITKPRDNVIVEYCAIGACKNHAIADTACEMNAVVREEIEAWSAITKNLSIYDYSTNFCHYVSPFPDFDVLRDNMRYFHENHAVKIFSQGIWNCENNGEFGEMRAYLLAKLMWDPYMTEEEFYRHMDEFLEGYYGAGWENIRRYIDYVTENSSTKNACFNVYYHPNVIYDMPLLGERCEEIDAWFDAAEAAAETEAHLANVKRCRLQYTYLKLISTFDTRRAGDDETKAALYAEAAAFHKSLLDGHIMINETHSVDPKQDTTVSPIYWSPHPFT